MYLQYGCGLCAPNEWKNFDSSPTLQLQRLPLVGKLIKNATKVHFPENVIYGDIVKGLPVNLNSCDGIYSSHTLEHLSLNDFRSALSNTYKILKVGGIFRCVVPDLESYARTYINNIEKGNENSSLIFLFDDTLLGYKNRNRNVTKILTSYFSNSNHLTMWDNLSLINELTKIGFTRVRKCKFNDSTDSMFKHVEDINRFQNAVSIECIK
jgi:SAM-dependent methyltransferase